MTNPSRQKVKILVVSGQEDLLSFTESILTDSHRTVLVAKTPALAMKKIFQEPPDLVLLDLETPHDDGETISERLKRDVLYRHIPILVLGSHKKRPAPDKKESGGTAHDFLETPFESDQLLTCVHDLLSRTARDLDANPRTRLPGHATYQRELDSRIHRKKPFVTLTIDLSHFTAYNDRYGMEHGDEVLTTLARMLLEVVRLHGTSEDFVGHLGGDDFSLITTPDKAERIASEIVTRFDESRGWFYDDTERRNGWIALKDRRGREVKSPLMTIACVGVSSATHAFRHAGEPGRWARELLRYAKSSGRSLYCIDRRSTLEPAGARR